jgi:nitrogen regulatory protein PII
MAKLVRAMIREDKVDAVVTALEQAGVDGVTVTMAQGGGSTPRLAPFAATPPARCSQFLMQLGGATFCALYAFAFTFVISNS